MAKSTVIAHLRVSQVIVDRLRAYAQERGITMAQAHRLILAEALRPRAPRPDPDPRPVMDLVSEREAA